MNKEEQPIAILKIGNRDYTIKIIEGLNKEMNYLGMIDYNKLEICLDSEHIKSVDAGNTLLHEIFHGCLHFLGYTEQSELMIRGLTNIFELFMKENEIIFSGSIPILCTDFKPQDIGAEKKGAKNLYESLTIEKCKTGISALERVIEILEGYERDKKTQDAINRLVECWNDLKEVCRDKEDLI